MSDMSKGYGSPVGPGMGRGCFSERKNMAKVPEKGSEMRKSSPMQGPDAAKVMKMAAAEGRMDNLRGKMG